MTPALIAYLGGVACLAVLIAQALVDDHHRALAAALDAGLIDRAVQAGQAAELAVLERQLARSALLGGGDEHAGHHRMDVDPYHHQLGVGRYAHLREDELAAAAARDQRRLGPLRPAEVIDLRRLRMRGAVPTVAEVDDEWYAAVVAS